MFVYVCACSILAGEAGRQWNGGRFHWLLLASSKPVMLMLVETGTNVLCLGCQGMICLRPRSKAGKSLSICELYERTHYEFYIVVQMFFHV